MVSMPKCSFPPNRADRNYGRRIEDNTGYRAIVRAYNSWLAEEYCAAAPDRLIGILPLAMKL